MEGANNQAGLAVPPPKAQKVEDLVIGIVASASCEVVLREQASSQFLLLLKNTTDTNKKMTKDTVLSILSKSTAVSLESECDFGWEMSLKADVFLQKLENMH